MKRDGITNAQIINVLQKNCGLIAPTAKKLGIGRRTLYDWIDADNELKEEIKSCKEAQVDYSESKLFKQIKDGDTTAIIFHLKTMGKKRGYVERQEFSEHVEQPLFGDDTEAEDTELYDDINE